jgi:hypothetical protein
MASDRNHSVRFAFEESQLVLSAQNLEAGDVREVVPADLEGAPLFTGFNVKYFQDILTATRGDKLQIEPRLAESWKAIDNKRQIRLKQEMMLGKEHQASMAAMFKEAKDAIRAGKVRYLGVSNHRAWRIAEIVALCREAGIPAPAVCQPYYNAFNRMPEVETLPACGHYGIGVGAKDRRPGRSRLRGSGGCGMRRSG